MILQKPSIFSLLFILTLLSTCSVDVQIDISAFEVENILSENRNEESSIASEVTSVFSFRYNEIIETEKLYGFPDLMSLDMPLSEIKNLEIFRYTGNFLPELKNKSIRKPGNSMVIDTGNVDFPTNIPENVRHLGIIVSKEKSFKESDIPFKSLHSVHLRFNNEIFSSGILSLLQNPKVESISLRIDGDNIFRPDLRGLANIKTIAIDVNCVDGNFFYSAGKEVFNWIVEFKNLEVLYIRGNSCNQKLEFDPLYSLGTLRKLKQVYITGLEWKKVLGHTVTKNNYFEFRNEKSNIEGKLNAVKYLDIYGDFPGDINQLIVKPDSIERVRIYGASDDKSVDRIINSFKNLRFLHLKVKKFNGGIIDFEKYKYLEHLHLESDLSEGHIEITGNSNLRKLIIILDSKRKSTVSLRKIYSVEFLKLQLPRTEVHLKSQLSSIKHLILEKMAIKEFGNFSFPALDLLIVNSTSETLDFSGAIALKDLLIKDFSGNLKAALNSQKKIESLYLLNPNFTLNINDLHYKIKNLFVLFENNNERINKNLTGIRGLESLVIKSYPGSKKQNFNKCPKIYPIPSLTRVEISDLEFTSTLLIELSALAKLKFLKLDGIIVNNCNRILEKCEFESKKCDPFSLVCDALSLPGKNAFPVLEKLEVSEKTEVENALMFENHFKFFASLKNLKKFKYDYWKSWKAKKVRDVFIENKWTCNKLENSTTLNCKRK